MFLPTTREELGHLGWDTLDIILVTGDAYIDSPHIGIAVVGKALVKAGFRVGIIGQPDTKTSADITRLGEPTLFWGISGGSIDSLVANYTALKKRRKSDDYTPGGINNRRPDRAAISYANLVRQYAVEKRPIVLGGIEASMRRVAHYDFWSDSIRRSLLFDAKADVLVYGMGEYPVVELARRMSEGSDYRDMRGICYIAKDHPEGAVDLASFEEVSADPQAFTEMFHLFYRNNDPHNGARMSQKHGNRFLVHNPPWPVLTEPELDAVYAMDYEHEVHPFYRALGEVRATETIRFSLTTHRGCFGRCNFCSITVHEGATVVSRSEASIISEARRLTGHPGFKGYIQDVGGASANMYAMGCTRTGAGGACRRRCVYPDVCPHLHVSHERQTALLKKLRAIPGIKKAFVASGVRYDLICADTRHGQAYLDELTGHHISGQMKIAPEHVVQRVLCLMAKADVRWLQPFRDAFFTLTERKGKVQFLTYYFIAAHPGCTEADMKRLNTFATKNLRLLPEQVQIFTPTPSTYSTLMYYTAQDPFTGEKIFVEKDPVKKQRQKDILTTGQR